MFMRKANMHEYQLNTLNTWTDGDSDSTSTNTLTKNLSGLGSDMIILVK